MNNMYEQIRQNKQKTILIMCAFMIFVNIVAIAFVYGTEFYFVNKFFTVFVIDIFAILYVIISLKSSTAIVMGLNHGKEISREDNLFLWNTVENLSLVARIPMPKIYIVEEGSPNAFAVGMTPDNAAIGITTGLLAKLNREEIESVVAHELAHIASRDSRVSSVAIALTAVIILISDMCIFADSDSDNTFGAIAAIFVHLFAPLIAYMITRALSRNREYSADAMAVMYCRNPMALVSALEKISSDNDPVDNISPTCATLYFDEPTKVNMDNREERAGLFDTHPPVSKRIERLRLM